MSLSRAQIIDYLTWQLGTLQAEGCDWLPQRKGERVARSATNTTAPAATAEVAMPSSVAPVVVQPAAAKPTAVKTAATQPAAAQPVAAQPVAAKPAAAVGHDDLEKIAHELQDCQRCKLCQGRTHIVLSRGNPAAELMFIGEAPGHDEDLKGEPFVGRAGQLLDKIIVAMGFKRDEVFIANIVKCRPPQNRAPEADEVASCLPYLQRQIAVVKPKYICALGSVAVQTLLRTEERISNLRGNFYEYQGVPLLATYHPAYLLRNPSAKKVVWEDVKQISQRLGRQHAA